MGRKDTKMTKSFAYAKRGSWNVSAIATWLIDLHLSLNTNFKNTPKWAPSKPTKNHTWDPEYALHVLCKPHSPSDHATLFQPSDNKTMWAPPYFTILQPSSTLFDYHCAHRTDTNDTSEKVRNRTTRSLSLSFLSSIGVWDCVFRGRHYITVLSRVLGLLAPHFHSRCDVVFAPNDGTDTPCFFSKLDDPSFLCILHPPLLR